VVHNIVELVLTAYKIRNFAQKQSKRYNEMLLAVSYMLEAATKIELGEVANTERLETMDDVYNHAIKRATLVASAQKNLSQPIKTQQ